jgi:hypothetical protein
MFDQTDSPVTPSTFERTTPMDASHSKSTPVNLLPESLPPGTAQWFSRKKTEEILGINPPTLYQLEMKVKRQLDEPLFRTRKVAGCTEFYRVDVENAIGYFQLHKHKKGQARSLKEYMARRAAEKAQIAKSYEDKVPPGEAPVKTDEPTYFGVPVADITRVDNDPAWSARYTKQVQRYREYLWRAGVLRNAPESAPAPLQQIKEVRAVNDSWNDETVDDVTDEPLPTDESLVDEQPQLVPQLHVMKRVPTKLAVIGMREMAKIRGVSIAHLRYLLQTEPSSLPPRIQYPGCRKNLWRVEDVQAWQQQFINPTRKAA